LYLTGVKNSYIEIKQKVVGTSHASTNYPLSKSISTLKSKMGTPTPPVFEGTSQFILRFVDSTVVDGSEGAQGTVAASIVAKELKPPQPWTLRTLY